MRPAENSSAAMEVLRGASQSAGDGDRTVIMTEGSSAWPIPSPADKLSVA